MKTIDILSYGTQLSSSEQDNSLTLAHAAAQKALLGFEASRVDVLFFGSETRLYDVKPTGVMLGELLGVSPYSHIVDMEFACKAGLVALDLAQSQLMVGKGSYALALGADYGKGAPGDVLEQSLGSGAACFLLGEASEDFPALASMRTLSSYNSDTSDFWRQKNVEFPQHTGRYSSASYMHHSEMALLKALECSGKEISDYAHVVLHTPNAKLPLKFAEKFGISKKQLEAGWIIEESKNCLAAMVPLALCSVLEQAKSGEQILALSYGSGAGAMCIEFTKK